jgi:hypothetical protein
MTKQLVGIGSTPKNATESQKTKFSSTFNEKLKLASSTSAMNFPPAQKQYMTT